MKMNFKMMVCTLLICLSMFSAIRFNATPVSFVVDSGFAPIEAPITTNNDADRIVVDS